MMIGQKEFASITIADILALQTNDVRESKHLEYKRELPTEQKKSDFVTDVAAMANCGGGVILYGVVEKREGNEKTGAIESIPGLTIAALDTEIGKFNNLARSGIDPVITDLIIKPFHLEGGNIVIAVSVPQTSNAPHLIVAQGMNRFYSRNSTGNYPMEVSEIGSAFITRSTARDKALGWTAERYTAVVSGKAPAPLHLDDRAAIILHIVPWFAFSGARLIDVEQIESQTKNLLPLSTKSPSVRFNANGILAYGRLDEKTSKTFSYVQMFRTGQLESVDTSTIVKPDCLLHCVRFESDLRDRVSGYLQALQGLGVVPPITTVLSITNAAGLKFEIPKMHNWYYDYNPSINFNHESLLTASAQRIDSWEDLNLDNLLKPMFDTLWNACGWRSSPNFANGIWTPSLK